MAIPSSFLSKNMFRIKTLFLSFRLKITSLFTSEDYWKARYNAGDNSGDGSYGKLAQFKAKIINTFVHDNDIQTIIEFGSGDGNQLKLGNYPNYIGFDISQKAIELCQSEFSKDSTKQFKLMDEYNNETAELTMSLDVVYHLIEDSIYHNYMEKLFNASTKFVVVYASNKNKQELFQAPHVKHRKFTDWVSENNKNWQLIQHIPNKYPVDGETEAGSFADFFFFKKNL